MSTAFTCSLSGYPVIHPVVSLKTGHIFQKSTIVKHISVYGVCPHTQQTLSKADLLDIEISKNAMVTSPQYSDPESMGKKMQKQFDALVLQTYQLKKKLLESRQQLAHSLYRQDASIRVICKLKEEIEENQQQLAKSLKEVREMNMIGQI